MYRGTNPRNKKHTCSTCTQKKAVSHSDFQQSPQEPPTKKPRFIKQKVRPPPTPLSKSELKRYHTMFVDQEGGRIQFVTPVRAAVEQAKAMIAPTDERVGDEKGCKLTGGRIRKKVYNRKRCYTT